MGLHQMYSEYENGLQFTPVNILLTPGKGNATEQSDSGQLSSATLNNPTGVAKTGNVTLEW